MNGYDEKRDGYKKRCAWFCLIIEKPKLYISHINQNGKKNNKKKKWKNTFPDTRNMQPIDLDFYS